MVPYLALMASEVMFEPQDETEGGSLALSALDGLLKLSQTANFVVLGPGLSLSDETRELVRQLLFEVEQPLLIDGDVLTAISENLDVLRRRAPPTVLTMHPGKVSHIDGLPISEIQRNPIPVVQQVAEDLGAIVALRGAHTLIGLPDQRLYINLSGNPGMVSTGSGDLLSGTVAAMRGLGLPLKQAVGTGAFLHGFAGDLAARAKGQDGITAYDIVEQLPEAIKVYREDYRGVTADFCGAIEVI
jgi:NAD(P)H-hydrate epimerase